MPGTDVAFRMVYEGMRSVLGQCAVLTECMVLRLLPGGGCGISAALPPDLHTTRRSDSAMAYA
eukprot:3175521-Rhodomonas_salina.2